MATTAQIANNVGTLIGDDDQLLSLEDDSGLAEAIRAVWDMCRQETIRDGAWNAFMSRAELPALAPASARVIYPWQAAFQLPADNLRLIEVIELPDNRWSIEGKRILADSAGPIFIRYLRDIAEPAEWDALFATAFARRIAVQIGRRRAGGAYDLATGWKLYREAVMTAKGADARENPPQRHDMTDWELARFGGGGPLPYAD